MMEKKYQLVAWTRNVTERKSARLFMIPSLDHQMQEPYFNEIAMCSKERQRHKGHIDVSLARRFANVYEQNARFYFLTGNSGDGIRFLFKAAKFCQPYLRFEYVRLRDEALQMARRYSREDILQETEVRRIMQLTN